MQRPEFDHPFSRLYCSRCRQQARPRCRTPERSAAFGHWGWPRPHRRRAATARQPDIHIAVRPAYIRRSQFSSAAHRRPAELVRCHHFERRDGAWPRASKTPLFRRRRSLRGRGLLNHLAIGGTRRKRLARQPDGSARRGKWRTFQTEMRQRLLGTLLAFCTWQTTHTWSEFA